MISENKIRVYCPECGRLVGKCDSKSHIDKTYRCKKCNRMIVYHTDTGKQEIKDVSKRTCSSGMIFI